MEVVASLSLGSTSAAQCGLFTHKSVPVIFEPPCIYFNYSISKSVTLPNKIVQFVTNENIHFHGHSHVPE